MYAITDGLTLICAFKDLEDSEDFEFFEEWANFNDCILEEYPKAKRFVGYYFGNTDELKIGYKTVFSNSVEMYDFIDGLQKLLKSNLKISICN